MVKMPMFSLNWSYSGSSKRIFTTPLYSVLNPFITPNCDDGLGLREQEYSLISRREHCHHNHSFWRTRLHRVGTLMLPSDIGGLKSIEFLGTCRDAGILNETWGNIA